MLGLMFGFGLAFLIEFLNDLVRTPTDVARHLHIPLLGVIPDADEDDQVDEKDLVMAVRRVPYSIISESYRRFRTNLKLSGSKQLSKVLLISSPVPGDGKTSAAVNLATAFVAEKKKVLLIDANFFRPDLHNVFPVPQELAAEDVSEKELKRKRKSPKKAKPSEFGLSTFLAGLCSYTRIIRPSEIEGLDIIDSGPLPPNPAELLSSVNMQQLLKHQQQDYDYVIVDGPPVLLASESKSLARFVDGTILIFNAGSTRRGVAMRTIRELKEVNAPLIGCVLFAVKAMKGGYFSKQFSLYQKYQKPQLAHVQAD